MAAVHAFCASLYSFFGSGLFGSGAVELLGAAPVPNAFALLAVVAVGAALGWMAVRGCVAWPLFDGEATGRGLAMLRRSQRTGPVSLCDPDAPGKPRPRAPGTAPAVA